MLQKIDGVTATTIVVSNCANSQILINNECVDCSAFFPGCNHCSARNDHDKTIQCDICDFGFYLLTVPIKPNESILSPTPEDARMSMCVKRCEDFSYNFVSNESTMTCEYCGDGCTVCSIKFGCLDSFQLGHGYRTTTINYLTVFPYSSKQPSS